VSNCIAYYVVVGPSIIGVKRSGMKMMLLSWLWCLLLIAHLSCATTDWNNYDNDDDIQFSEDIANYDDLHEDDTVQLPRRRTRRQEQMPAVVDDVPASGAVDRAPLMFRRDRTQLRRRKKLLENGSRRGRGGGNRGWRRRGGSSFPETSASVFTTIMPTTVDQRTWTTSTATQPVTSHAVDLVTRDSEVAGDTEDNIRDRDVLIETTSDSDDDMMMILLPNNVTMITFADISQRGM